LGENDVSRTEAHEVVFKFTLTVRQVRA